MPGGILGFLHSKTCNELKQKEMLNYRVRKLLMMLTGSEYILMHLRGEHLLFRFLQPPCPRIRVILRNTPAEQLLSI